MSNTLVNDSFKYPVTVQQMPAEDLTRKIKAECGNLTPSDFFQVSRNYLAPSINVQKYREEVGQEALMPSIKKSGPSMS